MKVFTSDEILKIEAQAQALINILNKDCSQNLEYMRLNDISTWEVEGKWMVSNVTSKYIEHERDVVCEVRYRDNDSCKLEGMGIFLTQHQRKIENVDKNKDIKYEYGEVKRVTPINGKIINGKWVIRE